MRRPGRAIKQIKNPDDKIGDESNPPRPTTPPRPGTRKTFAPSFAFHVSPVTGIGHDRTPAVVPRPPLSAHEVSPRRRLSQDFRVEARIRDNNNNNNNNTSQGTPRSRVYRSPLPPPPLFLRTDLTIVVLSLSARTPTEYVRAWLMVFDKLRDRNRVYLWIEISYFGRRTKEWISLCVLYTRLVRKYKELK